MTMEVTDKAWAAPGAVTGTPKQLLRLEGLALAGAAITLYGWFGGPWWLFAALILAPDLSLFGFLSGPRPVLEHYFIISPTPLLCRSYWGLQPLSSLTRQPGTLP